MMKAIRAFAGLAMVVGVCAASTATAGPWQEKFDTSSCNLGPTGRNPFFVLEPGFQLVLEHKKDRLVITVLDETKEVDGVTTRVVEEREWSRGKLVEVSRNFFAICETTKDVFYFGEEVDMYWHEKLRNHKGTWLAGVNGARAGLIMPGDPQVGMRYYQELAPRVAMDRAEVVDLDVTMETPAGPFSKCLKTRESTALSIFERETKTYAAGIGLIQDAKLRLSKYGFVGEDGEPSKSSEGIR